MTQPSQVNPWTVTIAVNHTPVELHIDTGAEVTLISEQAWREVRQSTLSPPGRILRGPNARERATMGRFTAQLSKGERTTDEEVYVVKCLHKPLLGRPAIDELGLVMCIASVDKTVQPPIEKFPQLFEGRGKLQGDYWTGYSCKTERSLMHSQPPAE